MFGPHDNVVWSLKCIQLHAKYFATPLCALELKNLDPYNEGGEGPFINLTHERNE